MSAIARLLIILLCAEGIVDGLPWLWHRILAFLALEQPTWLQGLGFPLMLLLAALVGEVAGWIEWKCFQPYTRPVDEMPNDMYAKIAA
jgi:membrane protein implicated in regulation of membrane protease activity